MLTKLGEIKRVYVDMDNVAANWSKETIKRLNEAYHLNAVEEDLTCWKIEDCFESVSKDAYKLLNDDTFFISLETMIGCKLVLETLVSIGVEVMFVTVPEKALSSIDQKLRWVDKHFPFIGRRNVILGYYKSKSFLRGDNSILIDDNPSNLLGFTGVKMLYYAPHNQEYNAEDVIRVSNWFEIANLLNIKIDTED